MTLELLIYLIGTEHDVILDTLGNTELEIVHTATKLGCTKNAAY